MLKIGSMFSGYGGLDLAAEATFNAETAWQCEWEDAPSAILATHWPDVPNYRDVTAVDWTAVEPVDVITGGFPCQDVSLAGQRAGLTEGTRSNLWGAMRTAIETIQPRYVVAENVRGLLSAKAYSDSDMEPREGPMGNDGPPNLRAIGRVVSDLDELGYVGQWCGLRAADVGAPHGRFRVFILAERRDAIPHPGGIRGHQAIQHDGCEPATDNRASVPHQPDREPMRTGSKRWAPAEDTNFPTCGQRWQSASGQAEGGRSRSDIGGRGGAPATDTLSGRWERRGSHELAGAPADTAGHGEGRPTADASGIGRDQGWAESAGQLRGPHASLRGPSHDETADWGPYAPAIHRWEQLRGPAPAPTELTAKGKQRLSARFVEWMMGLPAGWITGVPISRNEQLKALGNGVVPQQAHAALVHMLHAQTV